jgi:hypothetical protein
MISEKEWQKWCGRCFQKSVTRVVLHGVLQWFLKSMRTLNAARQRMTPPLHLFLNVGTGEEEPNLKCATREETEEEEPNLKPATREEKEEEEPNLKPATRDETEKEEPNLKPATRDESEEEEPNLKPGCERPSTDLSLELSSAAFFETNSFETYLRLALANDKQFICQTDYAPLHKYLHAEDSILPVQIDKDFTTERETDLLILLARMNRKRQQTSAAPS